MAAGDVFFFGNGWGRGEGDNATGAPTKYRMGVAARANPASQWRNPALVDNVYDYNKDRFVNAADQFDIPQQRHQRSPPS